MTTFLDTSVLVAAFFGDHQHHESSIALYAEQDIASSCTAAHCLVEFYAVVTGMPGKARASPDEALLFLGDARERLTTVALDAAEYARFIEHAAALGLFGGGIYDALIAQCALKAQVQDIYTWNVKHFNRLGDHVAARVRQPPAKSVSTG